MMKMRLTTAPDIEAMTCAIGRKNSLLNNGIETTVRYMMTARMNMRTKLIWKRNWIFSWAWQNMRPWNKIIAPSKLHIFQLRLQLSSCWHAISNINFCIMNTILEDKIYISIISRSWQNQRSILLQKEIFCDLIQFLP